MKLKREAFVKVKLVLVNIRLKLDINMSVMVTNLDIGFGAWHFVCVCMHVFWSIYEVVFLLNFWSIMTTLKNILGIGTRLQHLKIQLRQRKN